LPAGPCGASMADGHFNEKRKDARKRHIDECAARTFGKAGQRKRRPSSRNVSLKNQRRAELLRRRIEELDLGLDISNSERGLF